MNGRIVHATILSRDCTATTFNNAGVFPLLGNRERNGFSLVIQEARAPFASRGIGRYEARVERVAGVIEIASRQRQIGKLVDVGPKAVDRYPVRARREIAR